eukprot:6474645-Amphidinium_carterae.1
MEASLALHIEQQVYLQILHGPNAVGNPCVFPARKGPVSMRLQTGFTTASKPDKKSQRRIDSRWQLRPKSSLSVGNMLS